MKKKLIELLNSNYGNADDLENINDKNFIGELQCRIVIYYIKFSYTTTRGNDKERTIYLTPMGFETLEFEFKKWLEDMPEYKKLSNVKILDSGISESYNIYL